MLVKKVSRLRRSKREEKDWDGKIKNSYRFENKTVRIINPILGFKRLLSNAGGLTVSS